MYWTLDTRPPTLDELVVMAKQRHAQRVEEIAAEEPVPQIEVAKSSPSKADRLDALLEGIDDVMDAVSMLRPGEFLEVAGSRSVQQLQDEIDAYASKRLRQHCNSRLLPTRLRDLQYVYSDSLRYGTGASMVGLGGIQHVPYKTLFDLECA
jgi:hypothetical protein